MSLATQLPRESTDRMFWKSLIEMTKGRVREFRREPSAFFFVLLMPIVGMFTVGLSFQAPPQGESGKTYMDFLIPGLLALSLWMTSLFGIGMIVVSHRRENLLKRFLTTPMKPYAYIFSHILGRFCIFFIECALVLGLGSLIFGFRIQGNPISFFSFAALGVSSFTALALCLGSRWRNTGAYSGVNNLISLPMMFLSGVWFSRAHFPGWFSWVPQLLPLSPLLDGLRKIANDGAALSQLGPECLILSFYLVGASVLAVKLFRWT